MSWPAGRGSPPAAVGWAVPAWTAGRSRSSRTARPRRPCCSSPSSSPSHSRHSGAEGLRTWMTATSVGPLHHRVPEFLDGRVDQFLITGQRGLDGPGPLVGEYLDLAGLDRVEGLPGD